MKTIFAILLLCCVNSRAEFLPNFFTTNSNPAVTSIVIGVTGTNAQIGGAIFKSFLSFTNHSTVGSFTNFANVTIPAHLLTNNGDTLRAYWGGKFLSGTNQLQVGYGSQTNFMDSGAQTNGAASAWNAWATITRTGNTSQHIEGEFYWNQGNGTPFSRTNFNAELAETNGIANALKLAGQAIRAGGITNNSFMVFYEPASR